MCGCVPQLTCAGRVVEALDGGRVLSPRGVRVVEVEVDRVRVVRAPVRENYLAVLLHRLALEDVDLFHFLTFL